MAVIELQSKCFNQRVSSQRVPIRVFQSEGSNQRVPVRGFQSDVCSHAVRGLQ